jgi:hypothetical protein
VGLFAAAVLVGTGLSLGPNINAQTAGDSGVPDPLVTESGQAVADIATWENTRRPEILELFSEHVYGQPLPAPVSQDFAVETSEHANGVQKSITAQITGTEGSGSFSANLYLPSAQLQGTFVLIDHRGSASGPDSTSGYAPIATLNQAGFAVAAIDAGGVSPDDAGSYRNGVIDLFYPAGQELPANAGKTIGAWAWSASRIMDYLVTDPDVDPNKVAVIGHSRGGKAALWAGALDNRFAAVISNDSGSTGAKLARASGGEDVSAINGQFPHWFSENYKQYNGNESALPVDQHMLLAAVAPRRVIVASATEDATANPEGEFRSYVGAAPVYALYGLGNTGLETDQWQPAADTLFRGDAMSYYLRTGGHGLTEAEWNAHMEGDIFSPGLPGATAGAAPQPAAGVAGGAVGAAGGVQAPVQQPQTQSTPPAQGGAVGQAPQPTQPQAPAVGSTTGSVTPAPWFANAAPQTQAQPQPQATQPAASSPPTGADGGAGSTSPEGPTDSFARSG